MHFSTGQMQQVKKCVPKLLIHLSVIERLPLWRGGSCSEVKIRENVWTACKDKKESLLWRGGHCGEVPISRGSTIYNITALTSCLLIANMHSQDIMGVTLC